MSLRTQPDPDVDLLPAPADHATPGLMRVARGTVPVAEMPAAVDRLQAYFEQGKVEPARDYAKAVNTYYNLVTDFYEYGWGQSFHFAPRARGETFRESLLRHEQWLALRLGLSPESKVLDVGCGVGGPMRTIARFAGCRITGLNNNAYQVDRANLHNRRAGLDGLCDVVKGDFMAMPFPDGSFDAVYAIEALVHSPRLGGAFAEIRRVLKPGGLMASYEWTMTQAFDPSDPRHQSLRHEIAANNGILQLSTWPEVLDSVPEAGLELIQAEDRCAGADIPWWEPLGPARHPFVLRRSSGIGKHFTAVSVRVLESLQIAPRGTTTVARVLDQGGQSLVAGGMQGLFTPGLLVVARKPA